jgi:hypothetical protein
LDQAKKEAVPVRERPKSREETPKKGWRVLAGKALFHDCLANPELVDPGVKMPNQAGTAQQKCAKSV